MFTTRMKKFTSVYFVAINISLMSCAKILGVFPTPSISHQVVFRPLVQELVRRGHEVTVITTDPIFSKEHALSNLTEIDVHDLSYKMWLDALGKKNTGNENDNLIAQIEVIMTTVTKIFEAQVATDDVQNIINKKKGHFDLLILEAFVQTTLAFTHIFKAPAIQISSFGGLQYNFESFGAPTHPLLYPAYLNQKIYNLTNVEKLQQVHAHWKIEKLFNSMEQENNILLKNMFGRDFPTIRKLFNNIDMLFLNIHSIWSDNQPVPPNVIYIGGIHTNPPKELPKDLDTMLNKSEHGVIYFSLGTNVKSSILPPKKIQMMIKVFSELPYDVIWKWDLDSMPGKPEKIKIFKWLPQSDLLRHPKIKLFITQGGLQSTDEAIEAGVPLIGVPLFADQWYNTEKYPHLKIGLKLDMPTLTEETFRNAIKTVINDNSYRENVIKLRNIIKDQPQKPLERAVWWTEYVLRHGGAKHLRAAGANITWTQYLELKLVVTVVLVSFTIILALALILFNTKNYLLQTFKAKIKIQ